MPFVQMGSWLDAFVEWTGYSRKYAIELLNHGEHGQQIIQRHRSVWYGQAVQQALFLAWKAAHYACAKRLLPFLPSLVAVLERQGHLAALSWLKFEWRKGSWALVGLAPTDRVGLHTRLAATVAFRLDQLKQLVGRAAN